jgi:hypothetical protein
MPHYEVFCNACKDLDRRGYNPHAGTLSRLRDDLVYLQRSQKFPNFVVSI